MWNWTGSVFIALTLLCVSHGAGSAAEADGRIQTCREKLGNGGTPNGSGGWIISEWETYPLLCVAGSLQDIELTSLLSVLAVTPRLDIVVRSTGGPVERWLMIAEHLAGKVERLYVDEACFSSCANYLVPIARTVVAGTNSLVVWHGGPNPITSEPLDGAGVADAIRYDELAARTKDLYERLGVDIRLLAYTAANPSPRKIADLRRTHGIKTGPISGYAVSPRRLERCFGFNNLRSMWHAGGDDEVFQLGQKRSERLVVLESPFSGNDNRFGCDPKP